MRLAGASQASPATGGWFCKQPLEVGENIRDEPDPPRIFGGRRLRKQRQEVTGLGHGFTPVGGSGKPNGDVTMPELGGNVLTPTRTAAVPA